VQASSYFESNQKGALVCAVQPCSLPPRFAEPGDQRQSDERDGRSPGIQSEDAFRNDLTLRSENALPHWTFLLEAENVFDQRGTAPAGEDGTLSVLPQPGRLIVFRASYRF